MLSRSSSGVTSCMPSLAPLLCFLVLGAAGLDESGVDKSTATEPKAERTPLLQFKSSQNVDGIEADSTPSLECWLNVPGQVWWSTGDRNLTTVNANSSGRLDIKKASRNDTGDYKCMAQTADGKLLEKNIHIRVIEPGKIVSGGDVRANVTDSANLTCHIYGYPLSQFSWLKENDSESSEHLRNLTDVTPINDTYSILYLKFKNLAKSGKDNGTYVCQASDYNGVVSTTVHLFVNDVPKVSIDFMKAVGAGSIYLNWTVNDGNKPIEKYFVYHMKNGTDGYVYYREQIGGGNSSYILKGFENGTAYKIGITAVNGLGSSHMQQDPRWITTLEKDPVFVPKVSVNGVTQDSITIRWTVPPLDLKEHVQYYNLMATHADQKREAVYHAEPITVYAFIGLEPATTYKFKIAACSEYTKQCGNWSAEVNGTTLDGMASPPKNLTVYCSFDNISRTSYIFITWDHPEKPNGVIQRYSIQGNGTATFRDETGRLNNTSFDLPSWSVYKKSNARYGHALPNTNYTVRVHGVTRSRTNGMDAVGNCTTPVAVPDRENMNMRTWRKIESQGRQLFKLYLPRISERNGPICCYRVYLVKLPPQKSVSDLPSPEETVVYSYQYAHSSPIGGAYIAETFDNDQLSSEIFLGDGESSHGGAMCDKCFGLRPKPAPPVLHLVPEVQTTTSTNNGSSTTVLTSTMTPTTAVSSISSSSSTTTSTSTVSTTSTVTTTTTTTTTTVTKVDTTTAVPLVREDFTEKVERRKREDSPVQRASVDGSAEPNVFLSHDGFFDETSNYTGFIEVIVFSSQKDQFLAAYSNYFHPLYGGVDPLSIAAVEVTTLGVILQLSIALILFIIVLLIALCILHRYTKRAQEREEIITLRNSFRSLRGRHQLVAASPPDMPPIPKGELLQAYLERHRDSDYGFQHEFELLPDRFTDRTTRASEAQENLYKNRYPDIKCYDQTRVRLAQMDGICGSDYINANFVLGYKERKKFICAQGPMENTVCDYWRMIWEQHLELILMLTNLEEYSKTKCAKYWPDKRETKNFGDITVEHVKERAYSDYVVRELKMTRLGERDARTIVQYHFLVWKDFVAPEHPHAILRFIKRVNEAYSLEKGPILVHCSAGVGRTGTLVALDSLLQQLAEEGQVSIFNTVCDLRHQRNFLVQSLKQYIFIYRALMEMAQYGDTEIPASQLKGTVAKLRQRDNGKEKCRMEEEYDKISSVLEDRKSFSVGGGEENRTKNRSELVIPYDRNRVILTPVPGREHSTYINASFIEGYDNSESFVITQDPLETTITDFWRMISEQCISTIVMLSDLNEGPRKCPRYWPDDETDYDHIRVRYIHSESCPYYTRREFCILNTKTDESGVVKQYQYHGWPTVEGEVPEVTRGLIELVDQTLTNDAETSGSLVVHCSYGSDRSSMFVALSILVQQLRTEKRVDIFTTTKKLRSQRHGMISTFAQYEFLHRAIVNYSDLHNLADDEPVS
ncbi:tyrosine-protein phosphatase 69D isoform X2 [Odontomachus brunneus]|uniref:tyrosine-protein phosphatase 69D isoform X2 n=1 Tax=Odontomachus brunneus TaxID=486640 RepID=UPI0013F18F5E|nr:tyrosine-protein phosphatase 69D isoform X2 [Odontomachus brunneus]